MKVFLVPEADFALNRLNYLAATWREMVSKETVNIIILNTSQLHFSRL